eukprot:5639523-Pyramimonas_sp.AAC.1
MRALDEAAHAGHRVVSERLGRNRVVSDRGIETALDISAPLSVIKSAVAKMYAAGGLRPRSPPSRRWSSGSRSPR